MSLLPDDREVNKFLIIWYLVGITGFLIKPLQPLFKILTPFGMLMAGFLLMYFHEPKNLKSWLVFLGIALTGFTAELIGVNTQALFGNYQYGHSLGIRLWNTPLIIGINWLILIYCITSLTKSIRNNWYFPLIGALMMVAFDWLMEPVAISTDMWSWTGNEIPIKNYLDWFLISGFLFLMIRILRVEINNRIAKNLFIMQLVFFLVLNLISRITIF